MVDKGPLVDLDADDSSGAAGADFAATFVEEGGPVAKSLTDLRIEVEKLDPTTVDLSPSGVNRLLGAIPGVGTPLQRYFMRFESSQGVIDAIIRSLEAGRDVDLFASRFDAAGNRVAALQVAGERVLRLRIGHDPFCVGR